MQINDAYKCFKQEDWFFFGFLPFNFPLSGDLQEMLLVSVKYDKDLKISKSLIWILKSLFLHIKQRETHMHI